MQDLRHVAGAAACVEDSRVEIGDASADESGGDRDIRVTAAPELLVVIARPFIVARRQGGMVAVCPLNALEPGFELLHKMSLHVPAISSRLCFSMIDLTLSENEQSIPDLALLAGQASP